MVQRDGELLDPAVLDAQARDFALEPRHPRGIARERAREREEEHDEDRDGDRGPLPYLDDAKREPVLPRIEIAVGVDDERHVPLAHPSNGAPRISSSTRARSSFE